MTNATITDSGTPYGADDGETPATDRTTDAAERSIGTADRPADAAERPADATRDAARASDAGAAPSAEAGASFDAAGADLGDRDREWRALPQRVRRVWLVNEALSTLAALAVCAMAAAICLANGWWDFWQPLIIGLVAAYSVLDLAFQPLQTTYAYAFNRFSIGEKDLRLRKGWLFRSTTTVPFNRVQHVDTKQNPVLRHFRLTSVVVHTAVDTHEIEALNDAEAERMVELITERVAYAKEDL